jgi:hypothetical protein
MISDGTLKMAREGSCEKIASAGRQFPLKISFLLLIGIIVVGYIISAEMTKLIFYSKVKV